MQNLWRLKIDLDKNSINELEKKLNTTFSINFKDFLVATNASSPTNNTVVFNDVEYVINSVLNFNNDAKYKIEYIYNNLKEDINNNIPFANDGFGNYYVIDKNDNVLFYDSEKNRLISLCNIKTFILKIEQNNGWFFIYSIATKYGVCWF